MSQATNISSSSKVKSGLKKNLFTICILAFAGSIIYAMPYFRNYYYNDYMSVYNLNNVQMGALGSAYGLLGLVSYFIGGVLADKFPAKKLLIISLVATGLGGFLHLVVNSFEGLVILYGLWGFTSLLMFWPPLMKVMRTLGNDDEQSRVYGIFEGGRGVVNAGHLAIATAIFGFFQAKAAPNLGLNWIIIFYSVCPIVCAIILAIVLKEPEKDNKEKTQSLKLKDMLEVIKMPAVWMVIIITFSTYVFNISFYYFTPYASNVIGASAVFAAIITVLAQYIRPVSSVAGGCLADKFGKGQTMLVGFLAMAVGTLILVLASSLQGSLQVGMLIFACIIIYLAMYSNFGIYFSLLSEGRIPLEKSGVAIGLVSTLGYLPEVLCPLAAGKTLDAFSGVTGYHMYFIGMAVVATIGAIFCFIWIKKYGNNFNKKSKTQGE
ncbi:MFS transporter [Terrisporobacter glycolicus]|uniref:Inner membrane protein YihN n=1 Tax=Terrisporobacter glycolicus ATCC 14880 = DSM 1288 TaxID=1121315 RepID=A0ABZ2ESP4_9FIRM|nr:MFS transporter [Terrisporobacter glycolicus]